MLDTAHAHSFRRFVTRPRLLMLWYICPNMSKPTILPLSSLRLLGEERLDLDTSRG